MRIIKPDWPAPENVIAFTTTRTQGRSQGPYNSFNLAQHVGDCRQLVTANRGILQAELPAETRIQWLSQEHGTKAVDANNTDGVPAADACYTRHLGAACAVMTADCLPVLLCARSGNEVAAIHAGWRGLSGGVIENCVEAMTSHASQLIAWLGPAIGPNAFEVGEDVLDSFIAYSHPEFQLSTSACFRGQVDKPGYFFADIYALARIRLAAAGVGEVFGGTYCTYTDSASFYSYRRDGQTGRMATITALKPHLK